MGKDQRPASHVLASGAQIVPITSDDTSIARLDTDPTISWKAENASITDSDPTFGRVRFQPKTAVALVKVSRELVEDSLNIETALSQAFVGSFAAEVDRVSLEGSGTGSEPTGLLNMSGINELDLDGEFGNYLPLLQAYEAVMDDNSMPDGNVLLAPRDWTQLQQLMDSNGQPVNPPSALKDVIYRPTKSISTVGGVDNNASTVYVGRWTDFLIGLRTDVRIELLKETFAGSLQYGFLAYMRMDVAVRYNGSFCRIINVKNPGT